MAKNKPKDKLFVVRKFIMASCAKDALKKEKTRLPDDCYIHQQWETVNLAELESVIGFSINEDE